MRLAKPAFLVLGCAVSMLVAGASLAAVPSPANSTLPACVTICPNGDMAFRVTVRDLANNPVNGSLVDIDFSPCPIVAICPPAPGDGYTVAGKNVWVITNAVGDAIFPIHAGGVCDPNTVRIFADGILLGTRDVTSPDQNGSLFVTGADQVLQAGGAATPGKDLNCDGARTALDAGILAAHMGHTCNGVVGTRPGSWGTLKILYR